jgi:hypothetical protein
VRCELIGVGDNNGVAMLVRSGPLRLDAALAVHVERPDLGVGEALLSGGGGGAGGVSGGGGGNKHLQYRRHYGLCGCVCGCLGEEDEVALAASASRPAAEAFEEGADAWFDVPLPPTALLGNLQRVMLWVEGEEGEEGVLWCPMQVTVTEIGGSGGGGGWWETGDLMVSGEGVRQAEGRDGFVEAALVWTTGGGWGAAAREQQQQQQQAQEPELVEPHPCWYWGKAIKEAFGRVGF